ncbi:MAG TPA: hypothetical protein VHT24_09115 [Pseudacidobacterium sp.]|jgi:hypothetical protein|nr:hypothetical protein [Pseudacidobacterium sp.]
MYLWKYWRESRIVFLACVVGIAYLYIRVLGIQVNNPGNMKLIAKGFQMLVYVQMIPLCFVGWLFGSIGAGRDLGEKSGSFLFTRPRSRAFFVWSDWAFGIVQLFILVALINGVEWLQVHRDFQEVGMHDRVLFSGGTSYSLITVIGLTGFIIFLVVALVFSLTYFFTIVVKNIRGVILGAGVLVGYVFLAARIKHYWPNVELPSLMQRPFAIFNEGITGFTDHLGMLLLLRTAIILLFPLAAQIVLQKVDI